MRVHLLSLFLSFFFALPLAAADEVHKHEVPSEVHDDAVPSLINLTSLPSAIVNGCVNVITGDLCEVNEDDVVSGPSPYVLGHSYLSSSLEEGNLGDGWNFMHHHLLEVFQPGRIKYVKKGDEELPPFLYPIEWTDFYQEYTGEYLIPEPAFQAVDTYESDSSSFMSSFASTDDDSEKSSWGLFSHPLDFLHGLFVEKGMEDLARDRRASHGGAITGGSHEPRDPRHDPVFLSIYEPSGGRLLFKTDYDEDHKEHSLRKFKLVTKKSGFTNVSGGKMSGQTNIKNIEVEWHKQHDTFHVKLGDGTKRVYESQKPRHHDAYYRDYQLREEIKPNGNVVKYDYNHDHEIKRITTYNKDEKELNWVKFDQRSVGDFAKHHSLDVETSDGLKHTYHFERVKGSHMHGTYCICKIERQGMPDTHFHYSKKDHRHKIRVDEKRSDDGFYIKTKYYHRGDNTVGRATVEPHGKKEKKFLLGRVKYQKSPVGPNGEEVTTHRYYYYMDEHGAGHCTVKDHYGTFTRYYWNKDKRLFRICKFDSNKKRLKKELFIWGENGTGHEGRLRGYKLKDEDNKTRLARKYHYDSHGNVLEESLFARITENSGEVRFHQDLTHDETCDEVKTIYTYSEDGRNLKMSERDPRGNFTYYEYVKETNLLSAKFSCEGKHIRKREFFEYDKSGICIEHIFDDGHTEEKHNLERATERHVMRIKPRHKMPHFGEPEEIEEFCYNFDKKKEVRLKKIVNHFDDKGLVERSEITYQEGNKETYTFEYDEIGRLKRAIDPQGNWEYFEYTHNRLTKKHGKRWDVDWFFEYDTAGRVVKEIERHQDGLDLVTKYEYDYLGRKTAHVDPQGNKTAYVYDTLNRITSITYPEIYDHEGNKIIPNKTYSYEKLGSVVTETDELRNVTKTTYNALGKITDQKLPDGRLLHYRYDLKGNLAKEVHPNGAVTRYQYDYFDRREKSDLTIHNKPLCHKEVHYNHLHPIKEIGPCGETFEYTYDMAGNKSSQTFQRKRKTLYTHDSRGRLTQEKIYHNKTGFIGKAWDYDELNRPTFEKLFDNIQDVRTYSSYGYDHEGNRNAIRRNIEGEEVSTRIDYRPHGLPDTETDAEGHQTFHKYHYFHVNDHGQTVLRKETVDARGCKLEEVFDTRGNLSTSNRYDPSGTIIAKKALFYDHANNLVRINESAIVQGQEEKVICTNLTYKNGHLAAITEAHGTSEEKHTQYLYNSYGQLETITYADGKELHHEYDSKGRLKHLYSSDKTVDYHYKYDQSDRIISCNQTIREYNEFGDLIKETLETGLIIGYKYDKAGRCKEITLPDNSKVSYSYTTFLEAVNRLDDQGSLRYSHKILQRDLAGLIKSAELAHSTGSIKYRHDKLGRNTNINHAQFEQTTGGFDPVGNLRALDTKDPQGITERRFTYDFLSQLTEEKGPTTHSYTYDSLYNRLSQDDKRYDVNSLHSVLSDSTRTFAYDPRGNRTSSDNSTYTYDALDRLIVVQTQDKKYVYSYDAFNRRLKKEIYELSSLGWNLVNTIKYLYAKDNEIGAVDKDNHLIELRILGEGLGAEIGAAVALELSGSTYIPLHDRQGSIVALLNTTGQVAESYRFDAFGNETTSRAPINPWRFSSKRVDPETGLIYFGRRYYDPTLGKWLTQDPLGLKAGPNLYAYVLNCPLTKFDLYGLLQVEIEHMNQLNGYSGSENGQSGDTHAGRDADRRHSDTRQLNLPFLAPREEHESQRESFLGHLWGVFKEKAPGVAADGFEAMDQLSTATMLVQKNPYVTGGAAVVNVISKGGKILISFLKAPCVKQTIKPLVKRIVQHNLLSKKVASKANTLAQQEFKMTKDFVNLATEARTDHIIYGEGLGKGGHLWPGAPGKTPFPETWGPDKIMHQISDIATDPSISWNQTTGNIGASFTNAGKPVRFSALAEREGVKIKVIIEPGGEGIITGYPDP